MFIRFKVLSVKAEMGSQSITIETTHEIDPVTVTPSAIRITNPTDALEELLWKNKSVNGKLVTLYLEDVPKVNTRYLVRIKELRSVIDDELETEYSQSIIFESYIRSSLSFVEPVRHSIISQLTIVLDETLDLELDNRIKQNELESFKKEAENTLAEMLNKKDTILSSYERPYLWVEEQLENYLKIPAKGADYFEYEISSDPLFHSILIVPTKFYEKQISLSLDFASQIFIRCRGIYIQPTTEYVSYGDWINTTCVIENSTLRSAELSAITNDSRIELPLKILKSPSSGYLAMIYEFIFDAEEIILNEDASTQIIAKNIYSGDIFFIDHEPIIEGNKLILQTFGPLDENMLVEINLKNIRDNKYGYLNYFTTKLYTKLNPCYASIEDIQSLISIDSIDEALWYKHILNASKLADYYQNIKLTGARKNLKYYLANTEANNFEKEMFTKYYAASQILAVARCGMAYDNSFAGTLGEIKFEPKGAIPDLTSVLKNLISEAEKWKLALQGYKDHPADSTTAVKSQACTPHAHTRGDFR